MSDEYKFEPIPEDMKPTVGEQLVRARERIARLVKENFRLDGVASDLREMNFTLHMRYRNYRLANFRRLFGKKD